SSDTGSSTTDHITSTTSPAFDIAQVVALDTVVLLRDGSPVATRVGAGPLTDPGPVPDGTHSYATLQTDPSGQSSPPSASLAVTIDTKAPAPPPAPALFAADD